MLHEQSSRADQNLHSPWSKKSRRVIPACDLEDIPSLALDEDVCYYPLLGDNPLFDAFFVELTHDTAIVRLFKAAVPRKCVDSHDDAFGAVAALLDRARTCFSKPQARPEYVLVAPCTPQKEQSAQASALWDPAAQKRWNEFEGDVRVCYIKVNSLGCDVYTDNFFGCLPD